jgi:predicted dehydrogenase
MTIHVGLIGGGAISEAHARAARALSDVAIAGFYGTNAANVRRLGHTYNAVA